MSDTPVRKFGLIGYPLTHSFSKKYFTEKFERERIPGCAYETYSIPAITDLIPLLGDPALHGLNVTIPYKELVIPYLHAQDEVVLEVNACNCIKIERGELTGYNTDVIGFEKSLGLGKASHSHALILGTGGAAKAVEYVMKKLNIPCLSVSRHPRAGKNDITYEAVDVDLLRKHTLVINTTPVGMYPDVGQAPGLPYEAIGPEHYLYDLVYNPEKTLFLQRGEAQGATIRNGYEMLVLQAEESWRIWNG